MTPSSLSLNKDTVAPRLDDALESVNQMYPVGSVSTAGKMTHPLEYEKEQLSKVA